MITFGLSLSLLLAETHPNESRWLEEHSVPNHPERRQKTNTTPMNDYEKSPNAHRYFDDPDWPSTDK